MPRLARLAWSIIALCQQSCFRDGTCSHVWSSWMIQACASEATSQACASEATALNNVVCEVGEFVNYVA